MSALFFPLLIKDVRRNEGVTYLIVEGTDGKQAVRQHVGKQQVERDEIGKNY